MKFVVGAEVLKRLREAVVHCDPEGAQASAEQALEGGVDPVEVVEGGLIPGLQEVGERYGRGEYFLPDMMMAAEAFDRVFRMLEPRLAQGERRLKVRGVVVIGTVEGDIHSIGKDIVSTLLKTAGFEVYDLGVDVPIQRFLEGVEEFNPNILGLSALMTTTIPEQRRVIEALKEKGLRKRVKVMVGGAATSESWAREIGADGWAENGPEAVDKALKLVGGV